jgi:ribose 5-phosphate isomerase A
VDENLNGIKGGGGALLFEKIVANASKRNIWIVDSGKLVKTLGKFPLPVEIVRFGAEHTFRELEKREFKPKFRVTNNKRFITDGNHYLVDLEIGIIENPIKLNKELNEIPGVVETGLFCGIVDTVVAGKADSVKLIEKKERSNLNQI